MAVAPVGGETRRFPIAAAGAPVAASPAIIQGWIRSLVPVMRPMFIFSKGRKRAILRVETGDITEQVPNEDAAIAVNRAWLA